MGYTQHDYRVLSCKEDLHVIFEYNPYHYYWNHIVNSLTLLLSNLSISHDMEMHTYLLRLLCRLFPAFHFLFYIFSRPFLVYA